MHIPRLVLLIVAVVTMLAACTASETSEFRPIGNSPPIPMAASAELQDNVAKALDVPTPVVEKEIKCSEPSPDCVEGGKYVAERNACGACHSIDGTKNIGPTWLGLFGRTEAMTAGGSIVVDDAYIAESIRNPALKIVAGYENVMTPYDFLSDDEINALVEYIKTIQ